MSARLGYRSCRQHGSTPHGGGRIDVNCSDCVIWPKHKGDVVYLQELRVLLGMEKKPPPVVGDQLTIDERIPNRTRDCA